MSPERFEHLLSLVGPIISKRNTHLRESISAEQRLVITLRFLSSGDEQKSLSYSFRIGKTRVSNSLLALGSKNTTIIRGFSAWF